MAESENPVTGTESVPTNDADAVASISARLQAEPEGTTAKPAPKAGKDNPKPKDQADSGEAEPVSGDDDESDPKAATDDEGDDDGVEFPDTLEGIAEANGVDPDELASHIRVTVKQPDGTFKEVSIAELRNNHLFQSDYSRKTAELAEERRKFSAEVGQKSQQVQQREQQVDTLLHVLAQQIEQGPSDADLNRLAQEDPASYVAAKHKRDQQLMAFNQAFSARQQQEQQAQAEKAERVKNFRAEQQKLLAQKIPELTKPEEAQKFERQMTDTLRGVYGYSDAEISAFVNGGFDHRQVLLVRDAMKYRDGQKAGEQTRKKLKALPRVTKPGAAPSKTEQSGTKLDEQRRRLRSPKTRNDRKASEAAGLDLVKTLLRG